jgi:hypothetical protein
MRVGRSAKSRVGYTRDSFSRGGCLIYESVLEK